MKLPFDFGIRFVLRLVAPGALLAAFTLPAVRGLAALNYPGLSDTVLFIASGLVCGFALLLLDMPIYMTMEGRRFWPKWLHSWGVARQQSRLLKLNAKSAASAKLQRVEYQILAAQYPIDRTTGEPYVRYPTRLGNLLESFETYPTVKYGLDGVFFWPRLWVTIDKDLREELDSAQAVVDGAIYTSAVFAFAALICLGYWIFGMFTTWWHGPFSAIACLLLSGLLYATAIPRYAQYGEMFAAVFDQHREKLKAGSLLSDLDAHAQRPATTRSEREQWRAIFRFLRWHRYRPGPGAPNETVKDW
jgi:hypothetical protein